MHIFWLVLLIVLLVIEGATMGLTTIWFAGGALVALILVLVGASLLVQIIAFCLISALLLLVTRPFAMRYINKGGIRTNAESLIGKTVVITTKVDNLAETGETEINGLPWMVRSEDDAVTIDAGEKAEVVSISGVKLIVKKLGDN